MALLQRQTTSLFYCDYKAQTTVPPFYQLKVTVNKQAKISITSNFPAGQPPLFNSSFKTARDDKGLASDILYEVLVEPKLTSGVTSEIIPYSAPVYDRTFPIELCYSAGVTRYLYLSPSVRIAAGQDFTMSGTLLDFKAELVRCKQ